MITKSISAMLICMLLAWTMSVSTSAQTQQTDRQKQAEKVKIKIKKLGLGQPVKVKVKLYSDATHQGYVREANEDDFVVIDKTGNANIIKI